MNRIARHALAVLVLAFALVVCVFAVDALACVKPAPQTYTQRLHTMAAQVRAHGVPCAVEDASYGPIPCYWDASTMSNGRGESYVVLNGGTTEDGSQRVILVYRDRIVRNAYGI